MHILADVWNDKLSYFMYTVSALAEGKALHISKHLTKPSKNLVRSTHRRKLSDADTGLLNTWHILALGNWKGLSDSSKCTPETSIYKQQQFLKSLENIDSKES